MLSLRRLALIIVGTLLLATVAHAQSPLGVGSAEPSFSIGGPLGGFFRWINEHQQTFYRALTNALKAMREDPWALSGLIGLSFAYGVFHAAGPGHGKAVISSYMIANETALKRGMAISFVSALLQGFAAILLVIVAYFALRGTGITLTRATWVMEVASFAMIALFGAWLLTRKLWSLRRPAALKGLSMAAPTGPTGLRFEAVEVHDHSDLEPGNVCVDCGQMHMPDATAMGGKDFSLHEAWSAILAVGMRPCSGAILVMTFSLLNGLYLGGALSVLAMSIGTAITVSILATLAVTAKDIAVRFAGAGSNRAEKITISVEIIAAIFLMLMGLSLLGASLQA
ncbi:nickel/cobalt transporter [Neorhizobium sp. JUb45]|uniref:nickel/cobalt transporter n=1 Tax=unclassified Neorhizobium TaxID=2629175 RepID=UPI0010476483|nr:nickel/cobalt transporter [Neorhizobium sp. JUb45]TCR06345.1 ABC-type nickel/cobalt efflux system permease component RcnA [Neorhizobium sp. JUb45]